MTGGRFRTACLAGLLSLSAACAAPTTALIPSPPLAVAREAAAPSTATGRSMDPPGAGGAARDSRSRGAAREPGGAAPPAPIPSSPAGPRADLRTSLAEAFARTKEAIASRSPADAVPAWQALEGTPFEGDALFHQGVLLQLAGDGDGAAARYRRAAMRDPPHEGAEANLLGLLVLRGRIGEALPRAERVRKDPAAGAALRANAAAALLEAGRLDEAEALLRALEKSGTPTPSLSWNLAVLAWRRGDAASARALSAGLPPGVAGLWPVAASRRAWERGDGEPPDLQGASLPESRMEALHRNLAAYAAFRNGKAADAERLLAPLAAGGEFPAEVSTNLGLLQAEQGKWREARDNLEKAVGARPDFPEGWLNLGLFLDIFQGDAGGAGECFRRYIELNGPRREEVGKWVERLGRSAPRRPSP